MVHDVLPSCVAEATAVPSPGNRPTPAVPGPPATRSIRPALFGL